MAVPLELGVLFQPENPSFGVRSQIDFALGVFFCTMPVVLSALVDRLFERMKSERCEY
jgi:hypothetical protein